MNNNLWVFDTEDNKKAKLLMAYFYNGKDFIYCKNVKEVHDFLKTISRSKVWAHNLEYDINNIFSNEYDLFIDRFYFGSRLIRAYSGEYKINFYDTLNSSTRFMICAFLYEEGTLILFLAQKAFNCLTVHLL